MRGTVMTWTRSWRCTPDMVFENHTAGERAEGEAVGEHVASIFATWPDPRFLVTA